MYKGFTLVELLAVIIILGALTIITVISINPILKDSKEGLTDIQIDNIKESANLYYVKHGIGVDDFELENPKDCINVSELIESGYIDSDEVTNPKTGEKILGSIKVTYISNNYIYEYQDNACSNYDKGIICERVKSTDVGNIPEGKFIAGDAYNCKVDPDKEPYKFYILTTPDENSDMVNLIMDRNICEYGTPTEEGKTCLVAWNSSGSNTGGPVTAMNYLYNATKSWINIPSLDYTFNDRNFQGIATDNTTIGYTSFVSNNGEATITALDGTTISKIGSKTETLKARMPIKSEVTYSNGSNEYLYENLNSANNGENWHGASGKQPTNNIDGIGGYWTLSSGAGHSNYAWSVNYYGYVDSIDVDYDSNSGVRAVISVYKFQME